MPAVDFAAFAPVGDLFQGLLAVSLTGIICYTPQYDPAGSGEIVDFTFEYLNPAAQRMMRMPEQPTLTHLGQWPHSQEHGTFAFHAEAFVSGEPRELNINYQADGYDNYYCVAACRVGRVLLVSFTDTADQPRSPVELALRASQAREQAARAEVERQRGELQRLFEQAPVAMAVFQGPEHSVELANPSVLRLWGRTWAQAQHTPLFELLPEAAGQGFEELLAGVLATGEPYVAHELPSLIDRAGRQDTVYWNFVYQPLRGEGGQVAGVTVVATEVSEQVHARRQLQQLNDDLEARVAERTHAALALQADLLASAQRQAQQREAFYHVFEQTPALVQLLHSSGHRVEYVNPAYQRLFAGRQLVGRDLAEVIPELQAQGFIALLDRVYQTGETYYGTDVPFVVAPPADPPHPVYFNFTYQAYRENGQIAGISIFAYDVSEQVRARQAQEAQRRQLEQLFMQAPAPIVILDGPELVFQLVNPAYQRIFPGRELVDKPLLDALPELVDTPIPGLFRHVYETGEPVVVQELPLMMARHEGQALEEIYWTFSYQARRDAQGVIDGVRVFAHDITEPVRTRQAVATSAQQALALAEDLAAANQQLIRVNVDLDTFIYTASHDLKAPITNIEGLLYTLRGELPAQSPAGEVSYILDLMQDSVERFTRTIEHLTDVSKLHKTFEEPAHSVLLAATIEGVRLDLAPLLHATGGHLDVDVRAVATVTFSEKNLRSVMFNLLSNAFKYRHPDRAPTVRVRARPDGAYAVLEVQDNGLGLDLAQDQEKLFGMFQRLHTHVEGSGVGLYMVKRLVENASGHITVNSTIGEGSTFAVYLPR
ncbi:MAG: PAS domain-containing sensor histidine kinase [Janthinobacterium lividum]